MTIDAPKTNPGRRDVVKASVILPAAVGGLTLLSAARSPDPIAALLLPFASAADDAALSAAVIHQNRISYYNFGTLAKGSNVAATERSVYEIGSITKTFTGLILAHAIGEGRLSLSDPVTEYLPAGFDNLAVNGRAVTFADLVTTTSAIPNNIPDWRVTLHDVAPREIPSRYAGMLKDYTEADFLADLRKARLDGVPGKTARHSNAASQLLGIALERVYRQSYAALIARYIERPLGMRSGTGVVPAARLVTGYDGIAMPPLTMPAIKPAGGLRYSASDMARYVKAQIAARDPAIALTHKPLWGAGGAQQIGFHWTIDKAADGATYLRHGGGTFGFSSYCDFYPEQGYGVVLLINRAGEIQGRLPQLADAIRQRII